VATGKTTIAPDDSSLFLLTCFVSETFFRITLKCVGTRFAAKPESQSSVFDFRRLILIIYILFAQKAVIFFQFSGRRRILAATGTGKCRVKRA
jgi:hypothetical protein